MTHVLERSVRLFDADPDLIAGLDAASAARARRHTYVDIEELPAGLEAQKLRVGGCTLSEICSGDGPFGLLVLEGVLLRRVRLGRRRGVELIGSGALLSPLHDELDDSGLGCTSSWRVLERVTLAVLDQEFHLVALRLSGVLAELLRRATQRAYWQTLHLAIAQVPQLDQRLMLVLWHLADRWGRVEPDGVVLPLRLSQETIGELVCARRSSVNAALSGLVRRGAIRKVEAGGWMLLDLPPDDRRDGLAASAAGPLPPAVAT